MCMKYTGPAIQKVPTKCHQQKCSQYSTVSHAFYSEYYSTLYLLYSEQKMHYVYNTKQILPFYDAKMLLFLQVKLITNLYLMFLYSFCLYGRQRLSFLSVFFFLTLPSCSYLSGSLCSELLYKCCLFMVFKNTF